MANIRLPAGNVVIEDADGKPIITAPLLDIYYTMAAAHDEKLSEKDNMRAVAKVINKEFNAKITWGQAGYLLSLLDEEIEKVKKPVTKKQG